MPEHLFATVFHHIAKLVACLLSGIHTRSYSAHISIIWLSQIWLRCDCECEEKWRTNSQIKVQRALQVGAGGGGLTRSQTHGIHNSTAISQDIANRLKLSPPSLLCPNMRASTIIVRSIIECLSDACYYRCVSYDGGECAICSN